MPTDNEIRIPFAVHTAKFGYDWSNIPDGMTRAELDTCYRAAVARKPGYLKAGEIFSGTAEATGRKFVFSIQVAEAWDANGRNAEYSAFAFFPAILADRLFVEGLLARDEFCKPNRNPPTSVPCEIVRVPPVAGLPVSAPSASPVPEAPKPAPSVRRPKSAVAGIFSVRFPKIFPTLNWDIRLNPNARDRLNGSDVGWPKSNSTEVSGDVTGVRVLSWQEVPDSFNEEYHNTP